MTRDAGALRSLLEPLPVDRHPAAVAAWARRLDGDRLRTALAELGAGPVWERRLAVTAATATGASEHLATAVRDPSHLVSGPALKAAGRDATVPDDVLAAALDGAAATRREMYGAVRVPGRAALADRLVGPVAERFGDAEAAALLPACTEATVVAELPRLAHAVASWRTLAHRHPGPVFTRLESALAGLPAELRAAEWVHATPGALPALALADPARVVDLLDRLGPPVGLPSGLDRRLALLCRAAPHRAEALLSRAASGWSGLRWAPTAPSRALAGPLRALDDAAAGRVGAVVRDRPRVFARFLGAFPPSRRAAVLDAAHAGTSGAPEVDLRYVVLDDEVLEALPAARRHAEARRMLGLRSAAEDPDVRVARSAFLPPEEAEATLSAAIAAPEAAERGLGWASLVRCAARTRDPAALGRVVTRLARLRNEQDPVRTEALRALADGPPWLVAAAAGSDPSGLATVARDALAARDASAQTLTAVDTLARAALHVPDPDPALLAWARDTVGALARLRGWLEAGDVGRLPRGREQELLAGWEETLAALVRRGQHGSWLGAAQEFARARRPAAAFDAALARAVASPDASIAREAITCWLWPPVTRAERAAVLVRADRSALTLGPVQKVAAWRRTDLLDPLLAGKRLRGRFVDRRIRYVPLLPGASRWTPRRQAAYAGLLAEVADDRTTDTWTRMRATRTLGGLPDAGEGYLVRLVDDPEVMVAEAALAALADTAEPARALPVLLRHLDTDRARVAVFAVARCARHVLPADLGPMVASVLAGDTKVTARKQALRLVAEHRVPGGLDVLRRAWDDPSGHRDVRAAAAAGARAYLDDEEAWAVLGAATAEPAAAAAVVGTPPGTVADRHRARYGALVGTACRAPDDRVRALALAALPTWVRWAPDLLEVAAGLVTDLDTSRVPAAAEALVAGTVVRGDVEPLLGAVRALLATDAAEDRDGGPARDDGGDGDLGTGDGDRPARRRLETLVELIARRRPGAEPGPALAVADALSSADPYRAAAARLVASTLDPDRPAEAGSVAVRAAEMVTLRPLAAVGVGNALVERLDDAGRTWRPDASRAVAAALADRTDAASGVIATAVVAVAGLRTAWSAEWREALRALRRAPSPDVRDRALDVRMATDRG